MKAASGNAMQITWYEMKKAITSPIIVGLLVVFIAFNGFQLISESYAKEELKAVNAITSAYGHNITDNRLQHMENDINNEIKKVGTLQDAETYLEEMTFEKYEQMDNSQQKAIDQTSLHYRYYVLGMTLETRYKAINMDGLREDFFKTVPKQGRLGGFMDSQFAKWEGRYEEIIETGEYKEWFFAGEYGMHSKLFRSLVKNIAVQSVLLVVLITALITNYEVEQRTQLTIYSTKKGRSLVWHKFSAAMTVSFLCFLLLAGFSLGIFFLVYDYSSVWATPVSSGLNWEYKLPYILWWPLTVWQYLLLTLLTELAVVLIVVMLTFAISLFVKNSYFTWVLCIAMLIAVFLLPSFLNAFPVLQFVSSLNVAAVLLNPHMYFNGGTTFSMIQYFEMWTILFWLLIALLSSGWEIRRFLKKDVV